MASSRKGLFLWADQIPPASWTDLCNRSPQQAAEAVGAVWDGKSFKVPLIVVQYTVDPANQRIKTQRDPVRPN